MSFVVFCSDCLFKENQWCKQKRGYLYGLFIIESIQVDRNGFCLVYMKFKDGYLDLKTHLLNFINTVLVRSANCRQWIDVLSSCFCVVLLCVFVLSALWFTCLIYYKIAVTDVHLEYLTKNIHYRNRQTVSGQFIFHSQYHWLRKFIWYILSVQN